MPGGFQTVVYDQPAAGVPGSRASLNTNLFSVLAGPGGLVAGVGGVTIAAFCWTTPPVDGNETNQIAYSFGSGSPAGFVARELQGQNSTFLSYAGMTILQGYDVVAYTSGDFWVVNNGTTYCTPGMKAYASFTNGLVSFAATGAPTTGPTTTGTIAAATSSVTGSIADDVMTVTAVGSGTVYPGTTLSGTGVSTGTQVVSQITPLLAGEATGGIGRYLVSIGGQSAASTTISGTYGLFTSVSGASGGNFAPGQVLNATGSVVAGTTVTYIITGTGGVGSTMVVNNNTVVTSQVITAVSNIETKFFARSGGPAGAVIKISSTSLAGQVAA
ncbi:MAG TPA: hypothetical protein VG815_03685 [Chloroflexota bacterium]|jgi:hypothetical protein|nr:hypothetical protein [Chloroflexota bacterium]